jgi:hypothetical protein
MNRVVVYTALAGSFDILRDPDSVPGVDYVCFTDQPIKSNVWDVRPFRFVDESPILTAKHPKIFPHEYFPNHDLSIWCDANIRPLANIVNVMMSEMKRFDVAAFKHFRRKSPVEELAYLRKLKRWDDDNLAIQLAEYREYKGLRRFWECGVLARRHNNPAIVQAMQAWWTELLRFRQFRDQPAFAHIVCSHNLKIKTIPGNLRRASFLDFAKHKQKTIKEIVQPEVKKLKPKRRKPTRADFKNRVSYLRWKNAT